MFEDLKLLVALNAPVGSYVVEGKVYLPSGTELEATEKALEKAEVIRKESRIVAVEAIYKDKVNTFLKQIASIDGKPRRISNEGMEAQITVYNTFQSATALGLVDGLSDGAKQSLQSSLPILATLSTMVDTITTKIYSDGDYSQELQELKDYTYVAQGK